MFNHSHYKQIVSLLEKSNIQGFSERSSFGLIGYVKLENSFLSKIKVGNDLKPFQISVSEWTITFHFSNNDGLIEAIQFDDFDSFLDFLIDLITLFSTLKDLNIKHAEKFNNI